MDAFRTGFVVVSLFLPLVVVLFVLRSLWAARAHRAEEWPDALTVSVQHVLDHAKTGDILLFSGFGGDSSIIKGWSWSSWSHVGIIVRGSSGVYLWHANVDDSRLDAIRGRPLSDGGTQLNDLEVILRAYNGALIWRPLSQEIPSHLMNPIIKDYSEHDFNRSYLDMLSSTVTPVGSTIRALRGPVSGPADAHFCSELVTKTYQLVGALGKDLTPLFVHPVHFTDLNDTRMPWKEPYRPGFSYLVRPDPRTDPTVELPFFGGD